MTEPSGSNAILINRFCARKILQKTHDTEFLVYVTLRLKRENRILGFFLYPGEKENDVSYCELHRL